MKQSVMKLSIVIPVMNEEGNIGSLVSQVVDVLERLELYKPYEIIFVDDGSTDQTVAKIEAAASRYPQIQAIIFRRNFGKSAALMAGFHEAQGDVVITMDGDLQDEPTEIPALLEKLSEGYDMVSGWKKKRNDPLEKVLASRLFNGVISRVTGVKLHDFNCGFKAYRRWCLEHIHLRGNLYRFLPVFVHRQGGRIAELSVKHNKRLSGKSKYGLKRYFHGLFDMATMVLLSSFFYRPMYFFGLIGTPLLLLGISSSLYLLSRHLIWIFTGDLAYQLNNRPLLAIALGLCGLGLNILLVGLLAEMILQSSSIAEQGSLYSVSRKIGNGREST